MGWFFDDRVGHEGYLVAYVNTEESPSIWRELGYPERHEGEVKRLAVGCDCGWRSPRFIAPYGTKWAPFSVWLPERDEERYENLARDLWREHVQQCGVVKVDPASIFDLAKRLQGAA